VAPAGGHPPREPGRPEREPAGSDPYVLPGSGGHEGVSPRAPLVRDGDASRAPLVRDGGAALWDVLRAFLEARRAFRSIYRRYERRVLEAARGLGVPREHLVLPPEELARLFDLEVLERLRDERLAGLKRHAHEVFGDRGDEGLLDTYCGHAFSEVAILCEEHRAVGRFVRIHDPGRYRELFQEVSGYYPTRLRRIRRFFRQGLARVEELLPRWARHRVVVRSAYLFGEALARATWREGLEGLYARMYPQGGAALGYLEAARSFHAAGFDEEAGRAAERARAAVAAAPASGARAVPASVADEVDAFVRALGQVGAAAAAPDTPAEPSATPKTPGTTGAEAR
jgi:hypothetical protein